MWIFKLKNGFGIYLLDNIVFKELRIEMFCFFRGFSTVIRWSASTLRPSGAGCQIVLTISIHVTPLRG
jgi:hypothetical protein